MSERQQALRAASHVQPHGRTDEIDNPLPGAGDTNPGPEMAVIPVAGLRKRYWNVEAARDVDLAPQRRELYARREARADCRTAGKS